MANNEENRALRDYAMVLVTANQSGIRRPCIRAKHFEIKLVIIQMIQTSIYFSGLPNDNPNAHITNFFKICDTFKHNGVTDDAIKLRLFPFLLRDKAKMWLHSLQAGRLQQYWEDLAKTFLAKFFPPAKMAKFKNEII